MTTPDAVLTARQRGPRAVEPRAVEPRALAARLRGHPEAWPALGVLAAWAALLTLALRGGGQAAGMGAGMGMGPPGAGVWHRALAGLPSWSLMTVAMMGPAALPRIGHVGRSGARPVRAMTGFAVAYLAIWAAFGVLVQAAAAALPGVPGAPALAVALLAAVAWQLSPLKRRLLRACHRAAAGRRTAGDVTIPRALRHGARYGLCCLGACWCLMLAMTAVPAGQLPWLAGLTALVTAERVADDSRGAARGAAAALGVAAVATLAVGGLL